MNDEAIREQVAKLGRTINDSSIDARLDALEAKAQELWAKLGELLSYAGEGEGE